MKNISKIFSYGTQRPELLAKAQPDPGESLHPLRVIPPGEFSGVRTPAIRTEKLTRCYKSFTAVDNLNLAVHAGEIYGFLGSNGAGKTTTMKMLAGLLQPGAGGAWINGYDVWNEPAAHCGDVLTGLEVTSPVIDVCIGASGWDGAYIRMALEL